MLLFNDCEVNFDVEGRYCGVWQSKKLLKQWKINSLWESDCRETINPEFEFEMFALNLIQVNILGYR